jgi:sugar phosphate isomerase/epimerase
MIFSWLPDVVSRDLDRMLHYTLLWGFDAVELRMVGNARVPHVNEEKLLRRLAESEVEVSSVNPGIFEGPLEEKVSWMNDIALLPDVVRFCRHVGCDIIVASSFSGSSEGADLSVAADALRRAGDVVGKHGLRLAVLNEAGGAASTGDRLAELLALADHSAVAAAWAPAESVREGANAVEGMKALGDRVALVRVASIHQSENGWEGTTLDQSVVDWKEQIHLLKQTGFEGPISVEFMPGIEKKQALRDATAVAKELRAKR